MTAIVLHNAWMILANWTSVIASNIYQAWARHRQRQVQRELEARYGPDWLEKLTR